MLVDAMGIGRQSLYDAFGDKWQLYCASVRRYAKSECSAHLKALRSERRAVDGIEAMLRRVVETADQPCLGIGSICEFGNSRADLAAVNHAFGEILREAIGSRVEEAQADGDIAGHLKPTMIADFILANIAGLRIAGRGGADAGSLASLADVTLRALR